MIVEKKNKRATLWRELWLFVKAQLSAQVASLVDFLVTIFLATICGMFYLYATFIGSVFGGFVNCFVNYRWVFTNAHCKKSQVAIKYILVWIGSILLNTWGTFFLTEWMTGMRWVNDLLGKYVDNVFIIPKIIVSLLVGIFWNYYLQRVFVFQNKNVIGFWKHLFENTKYKD